LFVALPDVEGELLPAELPPPEGALDELPAAGAFAAALLASAPDDDAPPSELEEAAELEPEPAVADAFLALPL
jgi:hypothetical protein